MKNPTSKPRPRCHPALAALALLPLSASAGLLESYESSVPAIPAPPSPYISVEQSSAAGVTDGIRSMKIVYDYSAEYTYLDENYSSAEYADWYANDNLVFDIHRPVLTGDSKLDLWVGIDGPMGSHQKNLLNFSYMNAGSSVTQTLSFDYRAFRDAAPLPSGGSDTFQLSILTRSDFQVGASAIGGEVYIDNVRFEKILPVAAYTFDSTLEGFARYDGTYPDATYSTDFGGSIDLAPKPVDSGSAYAWHVRKSITSGYQLDRMKSLATNGGTVSFDMIGPAGSLEGTGFNTAIKVYETFKFIQVSQVVNAADITSLDDGNEIARITLAAAQYGSDFTSQNGYDFAVGYNGVEEFHIDNVMFSPDPATAELNFDTDEQNFTALPASSVTANSAGVSITNPAGYGGGASAVFTTGTGDAQVEAVYASLLEAANKGGMLRYKLKSIFVDTPLAAFGGLNTDTGFKDGSYNPRTFSYISRSALTEGGPPANQTPANYSRTIEAILYPAGSTATDGFVLPASAASYEFQIRSGYGATDASSVTFLIDDFEVVVNDAPEIIYTPPLPTGSGSFVGRVLSNVQVSGTFSASGLPPGVVIDTANGLVYGTPTTNGTYNVVFSVTRGGITDTLDALTWEITGAAGGVFPVIDSFTISGTTAVLTWSGTGSTPVNVERSTNLATGSWSVVSPGNSTGTFTDTPAPVGKAFYRLVVP